jgi:carboxypeptidase Taq
MRKRKPTGPAWITAAKPARSRRSPEQMLMELKQRLREISDLTAERRAELGSGDLHAARRCRRPKPTCAMLYSLSHERAVAPALGRLLDTLARYGESLPHDSDDASLIPVARRDFQTMIKIPPDHVARANAHGSASYDTWRRARSANDFPAMVPYLGTDARSEPGIFLLLCSVQACC